MKYLYRGVSVELHKKLHGKLVPKMLNSNFATVACMGDPHAILGAGIIMGESELNTVVLHQWEQAGLPTSGVSFTPYLERARFYAKNGKDRGKGFIYKVDMSLLDSNNVKWYSVNKLVPNPSIPEDDEYILVGFGGGEIPMEVVVSISEIA